MVVVTFPLASPSDECSACGRPTAGHFVDGRAVGCRQDVVVGQDQMTFARRLRLARLQGRPSRVRPFGVDVDAMEAR